MIYAQYLRRVVLSIHEDYCRKATVYELLVLLYANSVHFEALVKKNMISDYFAVIQIFLLYLYQ